MSYYYNLFSKKIHDQEEDFSNSDLKDFLTYCEKGDIGGVRSKLNDIFSFEKQKNIDINNNIYFYWLSDPVSVSFSYGLLSCLKSRNKLTLLYLLDIIEKNKIGILNITPILNYLFKIGDKDLMDRFNKYFPNFLKVYEKAHANFISSIRRGRRDQQIFAIRENYKEELIKNSIKSSYFSKNLNFWNFCFHNLNMEINIKDFVYLIKNKRFIEAEYLLEINEYKKIINNKINYGYSKRFKDFCTDERLDKYSKLSKLITWNEQEEIEGNNIRRKYIPELFYS